MDHLDDGHSFPTINDPMGAGASEAAQADLDLRKNTSEPPTLSMDAQYRSYVSIYNSVDNLIWRNVSIMLTVTIIAAGLVASLIPQEELVLGGLSHEASIGIGFLLIGLFYTISTFTFMRMKQHQEIMEKVLSEMERGGLVTGYFNKRVDIIQKWWLLDTTWNMILFWSLGAVTLGASFYYMVGSPVISILLIVGILISGAIYFYRNRSLAT